MQPDATVTGADLQPEVLDELLRARPWIRLIGVGCLLGALVAFISGVWLLASYASPQHSGSSVHVSTIAVSLLTAFLYAVLGVFLCRYASAMKRMRDAPSSGTLLEVGRRQTLFWRLLGVIAITYAVLEGVGFLFSA